MAWTLLVELGILALSLAASYYLRPKVANERAKKVGLGDINYPRADEGDAVPIAYGRVRINSPIVVSIPAASLRVDDSEFEGEYRSTDFYIAMKMVLALGNTPPSATTGGATFVAMLVGDKELPIVPFDLGPVAEPITPGSETFYLRSADILGGYQHGGGTYGVLVFYGGRWDQERRGFDIWSTEVAAEVPHYRGHVVVSLTGTTEDYGGEGDSGNPFYREGWNFGESPNLPNYSFVIENPVTIPGYEDVTGPIANGAASVPAVIYDLLTNEWGRIGNDPSTVDIDSFVGVAATLRDEEHGIALVIQQPNEAKDVVDQILKQIDGVLYIDGSTGKYTLRLIREDYDPDDIPVIDPSNVIGAPRKPSSLWQETVNEVRVVWTDPAKGYKNATAIAQDLANVAAQGGRRRPREFRFPGVTNARLAYHLASRELNFLSRPIERLEVTVDRTLFDLKPGDAVKFNWPAWNGYSNIFRVMDLDLGTLEAGSIRVTLVQDRFAFPANVFDPPDDEVGPTEHDPRPLVEWIATEAPRWVQKKLYDLGGLSNVDAQRGYYLAKPEGDDSRYRVDAEIGSTAAVSDTPARPFPAGFVVDLDYARTSGPYDTTTGLRIRGLYGTTLENATASEISTQGYNLFQVGGEIMAFEEHEDLGGGDHLLKKVWRANLDTVAADHAAGTPGYFLPGPQGIGAIGTNVLPHSAIVTAAVAAAFGSRWTPSWVNPEETFTATSRNRRPYPGAKLLVNASQTPAALEEEGVYLDWKDRLRTKETITRQDSTDEIPEAGTSFAVVAYKGLGPLEGGTQVVIASPHSSHTLKVALGAAGHGLLEVGVDARLTVAMPDGSSPILSGWQVPTLEVLAHHWRNLFLNPRATDVTTPGWTWTTGTVSTIVASPQGLGGGGGYFTAASGTAVLDGYQERSIAGYRPAGLRAVVDFAATRDPAGSDTGDTVTVYLYSVNAAGTILQTQTYGPAAPATWTWQTLSIGELHADAVAVRARVVLTAVGELDTTATSAVTEFHVRVGQISDQVLSNPMFATGSTTGWSATVGTWQVLSATPYGATYYVRPNDGASAQLRQAPAIAEGYEGSVAVLRFGRMNDAADDTGSVTLAALDSGGSVIASTSTATEVIPGTAIWVRRQLALELPAGTVTVRVQLDATRVTGTPLNSCFGSFDLRFHKHLDPDEEIEVTFDRGPTQRLPSNPFEWYRDFPEVTPPNHAIYAGQLTGRLGFEPTLESTGPDAIAQGTIVADMGLPSGALTTACYEIATRDGDAIRVSPIGSSFANFSNAQAWAVEVFFKVREGDWTTAAEICGRFRLTPSSLGWFIWIDVDGHPVVTVSGTTDEVSVTGTAVVTGGDLHGVAVHYDPATQEITLVDALGSYSADTSACGNWRWEDVGRFSIGSGTSGYLDPFVGQIARVYMWRGTVPSYTDLEDTITCAVTPAELMIDDYSSRTGSIAAVVGTNDYGVILETFGAGRVAVGYHQVTGGRALVTMPARTNLAPDTFDSVLWAPSAGPTITDRAAAGPDGHRTAALISGTNAQGYLLGTLTIGSAGSRYLVFFARAATAHTMRVKLLDDSGNTVATADIAVGTTWQPCGATLAWNGATSGQGKLLFCGSTTGSAQAFFLSPRMYFGSSPIWPGAIPIGAPGATAPTVDVSALSERINREGELEVELVINDAAAFTFARLHNGTNSNDARELAWDGGDLNGIHRTGSGGSNTATANAGAIDPAETPWTARLRWCRAALADNTGTEYSAVYASQGSPIYGSGRTSSWTASSTPVSVLDVGHNGGSDVTLGLVFRVRTSARERRL